MKKIFPLFVVVIIGLSASSQNLSVPHYGIKVGLNYSNLNFTQYNNLFFGIAEPTEGYAKPTTYYNPGFKAGAAAGEHLRGAFFFKKPNVFLSDHVV